MYNHAPPGYDCPFCRLGNGEDNPPDSFQSDVVYRDEQVCAFIAGTWYENNIAHVVVVPQRHVENIYDLTPEIGMHVQEGCRQVAIALKQVYECEGTSTRQHNEPAGNQSVFHYHVHVFPRYTGDNLYRSERRQSTREERAPYAERLRAYFAARTEAPAGPS
jgi:histidine triad (HIT) family protein